MKVSVPQETIEKTLAEYGVSQNQAVKACLDFAARPEPGSWSAFGREFSPYFMLNCGGPA